MMTILKKKRESDRKLIDARLKENIKSNGDCKNNSNSIVVLFLNSIDNNG